MTRRYRKRWVVESIGKSRVVVRWRTSRKVAYTRGRVEMVTVNDDVLMAVYADGLGQQWWLMKYLGAP